MVINSLPKNFDIGPHFYAYIFNQINREDQLIEYHKMIKESFLGQNVYTKEVAD